MKSKLPKLPGKHIICVICEGNEEYSYIERLKQLDVWDPQYEILPDNARGNGNIPARYQYCYQTGSYELVLVFCDTEKKPHEQYEDIKRKINEFHGVNDAAESVVIFANPCTLQIVVKHWSDDNIKTPAKPVNAMLIQELTGVKNYKARADQLEAIMKKMSEDNYCDMRRRVAQLESDDTALGSSNFGKFIRLLESHDDRWIEKINRILEA